MLRLLRIERKWFLNIYVTAVLQAKFGNIEVTFCRRCDVNHIRSGFLHKFCQIGEVGSNWKSRH